jgi:AcrR family transcriptional regulator
MPRRAESRQDRSRAARERLLPRRPPLQTRSRERVERILDTAVKLLAARGLESLSTAEIADRAGIPIGSIYHYFPSKEAILAEVAGRKLLAVDAAFTERFARDLARAPWRQALERAVDASVAAFRNDPAYLALWQAVRASPAFRSVALDSDERFARALEALPLLASLPPARRHLIVRTGIRVANAFTDWVLETEDPREAAGIVREMKRALVAYLEPDLESLARGDRA